MIELIPYMLIQLIWHPEQPGEFVIERRAQLYESREECERHGREYAAEYRDKKYTFQCLPVPAREEYRELYEEIERKSREQGENK